MENGPFEAEEGGTGRRENWNHFRDVTSVDRGGLGRSGLTQDSPRLGSLGVKSPAVPIEDLRAIAAVIRLSALQLDQVR